VKQKSSVKSTAIREANFFVLRGAQMPGVLVELDYVSNPVSEARLRSSRFTAQITKGVAEGILFYDRSVRATLSAPLAEGPHLSERKNK
jgi:N-acetylmuramoyl-L-alanine amidase